METDEERPSTEGSAQYYYKLVALVSERFYSIYDGKTEYVIGENMGQKAMAGHTGGYYVYNTP